MVRDCAILLRPNPGKHDYSARAPYTSGETDDVDWPCSPTHISPYTGSSSSHQSPDVDDIPTLVESGCANDMQHSPPMFRNPWSPYDDLRGEKIEFLRERCPSRSSSFLADVASLLSGLSLRSSLSRSSSGSSRRSRGSVSSKFEPSASELQGSWDAERPSPGNVCDEKSCSTRGLDRPCWWS